MRLSKIVEVEEKRALEKRFRTHRSGAVHSRCQIILRNAQGRPAVDMASIAGMCVLRIYSSGSSATARKA